MFDSAFLWIGVIVIIFIISVSLLIFAPKSINYYDSSTYPIIQYINENNTQIIKDEFYKIKNDTNWINYPDKESINGVCQIWPMYMFSIESTNRTKKCSGVYNLIKNIPDVKTCAFIKIGPKSEIKKNKQWKKLANTTLKCLFIIDSPNDVIDKCAVWVNGHAKTIKSNELIIFDSSKEHSIYNKTKHPLHMLVLDIKRPEKVPLGTSDKKYNTEIREFIYNLSQEDLIGNLSNTQI
jgi:aspartyl/asparaginyl beta-hydroxylase (cupin superfamily)